MFFRPFGLYCNACFGSLFVSILCTCCSHFFWYCFISFTILWHSSYTLIMEAVSFPKRRTLHTNAPKTTAQTFVMIAQGTSRRTWMWFLVQVPQNVRVNGSYTSFVLSFCLSVLVLTSVYLLIVGVEVIVALGYTHWHTLGSTRLDERSAHRRDLYQTKQNSRQRHPYPRPNSNPQSQQANGRRPHGHRDRWDHTLVW